MKRIYCCSWNPGYNMPEKSTSWFGCCCAMRKAFTLIELLVVIAIVSLLLTILLPVLRKARFEGRKIQCMANLHSIGLAVHAYAGDFNDTIPFGPKKLSPFFYAEGNVTSFLYLYYGTPVGLGILKDTYLADQPRTLFCPAADQRSVAKEELVKVDNLKRVQGDYYYRHASVALLSGVADKYHIRLSELGKNRNGIQIKALVMDVQFLADPSMSGWGVVTRTAHQEKISNVLMADSRVITAGNDSGEYTIDARTSPHNALDKILRAFEKADAPQ